MSPGPPEGAVSFEALYDEHADQVFVWAMRYAQGRRSWAEDITHDVFVKAWEHRAWLREEDVRGWLFRVTQNVAFTALRRESTLAGRLQSAVDSLLRPATPSTPEELLARRQTMDSATSALERLPPQERVVMALKTMDDLSQREIAQLLSLSEGYVSKLLGRARARLTSWGWRVDDVAP
ncbi:RNA polymerase sigma factor [Archangium lansingense]|uniref:RNA polymerase sigma factor n=1 Tax=Archangium lansingense TaxID=2995310 RepID=A0ABT3ZYF3_9BACT|nr:RNA polymerase sigma factor [Archangium lansinium]MCY1074427.1 RNA polymerase sigma factor [Archangium lansinium]